MKSSWTFSRCDRLRCPLDAQRCSPGRPSPLCRLSAWARRPAQGCDRRRPLCVSRCCGQVMRARLCRFCTAEPLHFRRSISNATAQEQSAWSNSFLDHRAATSADCRLAETLGEVDPKRIAFYGLSYGGKSAMRIPALVPDYCLSICSADFNDWVWKNASTTSPYSYVWTGEYEIFEFDLGTKFNYAEMAALIAPRPFMVERGHFDTVAPDERVGLEYAKVQNLYAARLKIPDRTQIEWFDGPHTINGRGTFEFLRKHLSLNR